MCAGQMWMCICVPGSASAHAGKGACAPLLRCKHGALPDEMLAYAHKPLTTSNCLRQSTKHMHVHMFVYASCRLDHCSAYWCTWQCARTCLGSKCAQKTPKARSFFKQHSRASLQERIWSREGATKRMCLLAGVLQGMFWARPSLMPIWALWVIKWITYNLELNDFPIQVNSADFLQKGGEG